MVGHGRGPLERTTIFEVRGDAGGTEAVAADLGLDAGRLGTSAHHRISIGRGKRRPCKLARSSPDGPKERPLGVILDPRSLHI